MKLVRYGARGAEGRGVMDAAGNIRDPSSHMTDVSGATLEQDQLEKLARIYLEELPAVSGQPRLGACVGGVGKIVCVGLNCSDHAAESNMAVPTELVLFMKATSAIVGPNNHVEIPPRSQKIDWEVEFGVVIGNSGRYISEASAADHVAGCCTVNHVSERHYQFMSLQSSDVISTGTPPGVGMGQKQPVFLQRGMSMRLGISSLGVQELRAVAAQVPLEPC